MLIVLGGCSNGNEVAGTGSSTGNAKIAGVILSEDGTPAANSVVYLIPENYNPIEKNHSDEIMIDTVDSDGYYSFEFEDSTSDAYNIDAMGIAGIFRYYTNGRIPSFDADENDLDTGYLKETGVLKVILSGDLYDSSTGYLYIPGTRVSAKLSAFSEYDDLNYTIFIDSVPASDYQTLQYARIDTNIAASSVIDTLFTVDALDTATIGEYQVIPVFDPGIFGIVKNGNSPVENAVVKLVLSDWDPVKGSAIPDSLIDTTDASGQFEIRVSDSTTDYNIIISAGSLGYFSDSISFSHDSLGPETYNVENHGYLKVILQDADIDTSNGYLFVTGSDLQVDLSDYEDFDQVNYTYLIDAAKVGEYGSVLLSDNSGNIQNTLFDAGFSITSTDTTVLGTAAPLIFSFSSTNSGLTNDNVYSVGADPYGGIWFGTHMGEFIRYTPNDTGNQWDVSEAADYGVYSSILSIAADLSDGTMWFGTHGAVFSLTPSTKTAPSMLYVYDNVTSYFPGGSVYSIAVDNNNVKWFGSYTQGVVSYDGYGWTHYHPGNSNLPSAYVYDIAVGSNNTKWIASRGGVSAFNGSNWTTYNKGNSALVCDTVFCTDIDDNGIVWAGFYDGSAASFDGFNWTVYNQGNSPLSGDAVNSVAVDLKGVKWFGLDNGHLLSFNGTEWKDYSQYIPSSTKRLLDIEIDSKNNKWVTTETAGVVLIDHTVE